MPPETYTCTIRCMASYYSNMADDVMFVRELAASNVGGKAANRVDEIIRVVCYED